MIMTWQASVALLCPPRQPGAKRTRPTAKARAANNTARRTAGKMAARWLATSCSLLLALLRVCSARAGGEDIFNRAEPLFATKQYTQAKALYLQAADPAGLGYRQAQFRLGQIFAFGFGNPMNHAEAAKWWALASAGPGGYAAGQFKLGNAYSSGQGVDPDPAKALALFRLAAGQGLREGKSRLGSVALEAKDGATALQWQVSACAAPS